MKALFASISFLLLFLGATTISASPPSKELTLEIKVLKNGEVFLSPTVSTVSGRPVTFDATTQDEVGKIAHRLEVNLLPTISGDAVTIEGAIETTVNDKPSAKVTESRTVESGKSLSYSIDVDGTKYLLQVVPTIK